MSEKYKVISAVEGRCGIDDSDLRISRRWPGQGSVVTFTKEELESLMYNPAFSNMVNEGKLYIESMEIKKELGLEEEDAKEPTIILLDENTLKRYWKDMPLSQFKIEIKKLTPSQVDSLAQYAITHGDQGSIEKANYLSSISNFEVLKGIELEQLDKEA